MSIELGNNLAEMRKKAGYSQEGVAEKLGVSRQAVSRWETGEASPDTENLIALAELYDVSLDELVGKKTAEEAKLVDDDKRYGKTFREKVQEDIEADLAKEREEDDEEEDAGVSARLRGLVNGLLFLAATVAYLCMGFAWRAPNGGAVGWAGGWVVFLLPAFLWSIYVAFKTGKMRRLAIPLLVVGVYVGMGIIGGFYGHNFWHPYWIEFFAIPVYYTIAGFVDSRPN